jgi:aquaporin Z
MDPRPFQRYVAEFLGTFGLLLFGAGTALTSLQLAGSVPTNGGAPDRVVDVSLAFGLALLGGAYAFGDISGAHFNPAVTVSMAVAGKMPRRDIVPYLVAQILGGLLAIEILLAVAEGNAAHGVTYLAAQSSAMTSQCYAGSFGSSVAPCTISLAGAFLLEASLTFGFVLVIHLVTRESFPARTLAPLAIGFMLLLTNLVAIPLDGASINPARSLAPAIVSLIWPSDRWAISEVWLFVVAPIVGGLVAAAVDRIFRPTKKTVEPPSLVG